MADFAPALAITLQNEGGFFHNGKTGEVVNMGITLDLLRRLGILKTTGPALESDIDFVRSLTVEEATDIYYQDFWFKMNLESFTSQDVANKVFDMAVNMGPGEAVKILQRAAGVIDDGVLGAKTVAAANAEQPETLLAGIRAGGRRFYTQLAAAQPVHAPDLPGWLARLNS